MAKCMLKFRNKYVHWTKSSANQQARLRLTPKPIPVTHHRSPSLHTRQPPPHLFRDPLGPVSPSFRLPAARAALGRGALVGPGEAVERPPSTAEGSAALQLVAPDPLCCPRCMATAQSASPWPGSPWCSMVYGWLLTWFGFGCLCDSCLCWMFDFNPEFWGKSATPASARWFKYMWKILKWKGCNAAALSSPNSWRSGLMEDPIVMVRNG